MMMILILALALINIPGAVAGSVLAGVAAGFNFGLFFTMALDLVFTHILEGKSNEM